MSTFFLADRVKELSHVQGQVDISLDGAIAGFSSFADFFASGDVVFYAITNNVQYEIGSGVYKMNGSTRSLTRNVIRSSDITVGPYHVEGTSTSGPTINQYGFFHPVWLNRSAALSGIGIAGGPFSTASGYTLAEFPGQTFYYVPEYAGSGQSFHPGLSGVDFNAASQPVNFSAGVKEVFVTFPGKTSVYTGAGLTDDTLEPKYSGIAFWRNEQIINYSPSLVFDNDNKRVGLSQPSPRYAIDIGGHPSYSIMNVSGIIEGGSGILFSGGQLTYTNLTASGGIQLEPFLRNQLGNAAQGVIQLSGLVDQFIGLSKQTPGTVFMGPTVDWCGGEPCDPNYPSFRALLVSDLPNLAGSYIVQQNNGLASESFNDGITASFLPGQVAIYSSSGSITYDSGLFYDYVDKRLLINADPNLTTPEYNLDVRGDLSAQSGYFNQLRFTDNLIRIGAGTASNLGNSTSNHYTIAIGLDAGSNLSGVFEGLFVGRNAGFDITSSSGVIGIGFNSLALSMAVQSLVAIGSDVGYDGNEMFTSTLIGTSAAYKALSVLDSVIIGEAAAARSTDLTRAVIIGPYAGSGLSTTSNLLAVGEKALADSVNITNTHAVGTKSLFGSNVITQTSSIGEYALENSSGITRTISTGMFSCSDAVTLDYATVAGYAAGSGLARGTNIVLIGDDAGRSAVDVRGVVALGERAAYQASGDQNIYIGKNAGVAVSGHNNIEIIASGSASSFLSHSASGKVNIGTIVVGDLYLGRVGIGNNLNANPDGTLVVSPKTANETAFIIRHQGSGSRLPYLALQSGDATTFFHVTNSGDVIHSGYISPSGGLLLPPITPSNWMNTTSNRLYNDAGTLKFNGLTITAGGAYSWNITDGAHAADTITDSQTLTVSGVSGLHTDYDPVNNILLIGASGLSGVLQQQITASNYVFFTAASGAGGANGVTKQMDRNAYLGISGVSGVLIDFLNRDDGINHSGVFIIGYDPNTTYSFSVTDGTVSNDTITNAQNITVSGVSGVSVSYNPATNFFRLSAHELSGVLQQQITTNYDYLVNEFGPISLSGVSGIAAYASGQIDSFTILSASSGIAVQNNTYILNPEGSGSLKRLNVDDNASVIIGRLAGHGMSDYGSGVIIGFEAQGNAILSSRSVSIGRQAAYQASGCSFGVHVGENAGASSSGCINSIMVGRNAGANAITSETLTSIGYDAGYNAGDMPESIFVGSSAGKNVNFESRTIAGAKGVTGKVVSIGFSSLLNAEYVQRSVAIGALAGASSSGVTNSIFVGNSAGQNASGVTSSLCFGASAGYQASGLNNVVLIGNSVASNGGTLADGIGIGSSALTRAGRSDGESGPDAERFVIIGNNAGTDMNGFDRAIAIGSFAGVASSGCKNSIFIGPYAGQSRRSPNSIILRANASPPSGVDADWATATTEIIDIGELIQGYARQTNQWPAVHIGRGLDSAAGLGKVTGNDVRDSALTITSPHEDYPILTLRFDPEATGINTSIQADAMRSQLRNATGSSESTWNTIVNANGWINLPVSTTYSGTGSNTILYDRNGVEIVKRAGVVVQYQFNQLGSYQYGLAICVNNGSLVGPLVWKKMAFTSEFTA